MSAHRDTIRARRAQEIWQRHLRSYFARPVRGRHVQVVRLTPTGNLLALVGPGRGPRSGEVAL